jgi:hypothetical protein
LTGRVERAYLRNYTTGSSRNSKTIQVFAFKLDRSPEILGVYRPMYDYASLIDSVRVGDEVTVYYKPAPHRSVDLDVFQIEKGNALILAFFDDYENIKSSLHDAKKSSGNLSRNVVEE